MKNFRLALRLLWKDKGFSIPTVLTLTLCIAANTALFSIVHSVLLRPLPVPDGDRLVLLYNSYPNAGAERGGAGVPDYYDRVKALKALDSLCLFNMRSVGIGENGRPERILAMNVTPSFFKVTRVQAEIGRTFLDEEGEVGRNDKVLLSYPLWQQHFGGDRSVIGRQVRIDGRQLTVVGVMPRSFVFMAPDVKVWRPLAFTPEQKGDDGRHNNSWTSIGRLRPGATIAQVQSQLNALNKADLDRFPAFKTILINAGFHTVVASLQDDLVRDIRGVLYLLWAGTGFVLLIGCVNVINLALVRSRSRLRELATRFAIGASRWNVARQLLTESAVIGFASGVLGLLLAWGAVRILGTMNLEQIPRASEIQVDAVSAMFTGLLAAVLAVIVAVFPLVGVLRVSPASVLHDAGRTGTGGRGARAVRRTLVVTQVAVAFVLLIGAGLLIASFRQVLSIDPGFNPTQVMTASVALPRAVYKDDDADRRFQSEALRRIRALPGVTNAGATSSIPFSGDHSDSVILAEGYQMRPGESLISPTQVEVSAGYMQAMSIPLKRGRYFDERDTKDSQAVVIVDERLANKFWPGRDPIGRRMYKPENANDLLAVTEKTKFLTVVGVVGNIKQDALVETRQSVGTYYFPTSQDPIAFITFAVKTGGNIDPEAVTTQIRRQIAAVDPELPVFETKSMDQWTSESLTTRRWPMMLSAGFALLALLLSGVGIYGVLAYLVTERTKEIGIRMAIGGTPRSIFDLVLREGTWLVGAGFAVGAVGAFMLRQYIATQLYGVQPADVRVLSAVTAVLAAVAIAACFVPARRATRIDPVTALNRE